MNYEEDKLPHRVNTPYSQKVYWTNGVEGGYICAGNEKDCTRVELGPNGNSGYPQLDFEMPRQKYELEKVERLMMLAYERGKHDRSLEIGKMMKELVAL